MFASVFQGAPYVEVYNSKDAHNCNPHSDKIKFYNDLITYSSSTSTVFDPDIKSYVLKSNAKVSSIEIPSKSKTELRLVQPILALQLKLPETNWSILIQVLDTTQTKRRIVLTNSVSKLNSQIFCATVPCSSVPTGIWLNLSVDLVKMMQLFKQATFRSLEGITINSIVSLKRIITVNSLKNTTDQFSFPLGVPFENFHIDESGQTIGLITQPNQEEPQKIPRNKKQIERTKKINVEQKQQKQQIDSQSQNLEQQNQEDPKPKIKQKPTTQLKQENEKRVKSQEKQKPTEKAEKPEKPSKRPMSSRPAQNSEINLDKINKSKVKKVQDSRDQIKRDQIMGSIFDKRTQNSSSIQNIMPTNKENRPINKQFEEDTDDIVDRLFQKKANKDPFHDLEVDYQPPKLPNKVVHIQSKGISFINKIGGNTVVQEEKRVQDPEELTRVVYDPWEDLNIDIYNGVKYKR